MKKLSPIHLVITGGTIDSYYDGTKDTAVTAKTSSLPAFLDSLKLGVSIKATTVCMKDSRSLTTADRKKVLTAVSRSSSKNVLITHGTYTMPDTARYLQANLKDNKKVIILTGSMIPLIGFSPSDAPFNLGFAVASFSSLEPGIYVAMNGKIFSPEEVVKQLNQGTFNSIFNK
jgi:L-asparaginase